MVRARLWVPIVAATLFHPVLAGAASPTAVAAPTIRDLVEVADIAGLVVSPDGTSVAYRIERPSIAGNDTSTAWYVAALDGLEAPRRIGDGGLMIRAPESADVELPQWSADGRWIYFRALINGQVQVWRAARDGSAQEQITHDAADVEAFTLDHAHHRLLYRVGASRAAIAYAEHHEYDDGILIDASVDPAMGLYHASIINGHRTTLRNTGVWFHHGRLLDSLPRKVRAVGLATFKEQPVSGIDPAVIGNGIQLYGKEKGSYYRIRTAAGDARGYATVRLTGTSKVLAVTRPDGATVICTAPQCTAAPIDLVQWAPHGDSVLFSTNDGAKERLYWWRVGAHSARLIAAAQGFWSGDRFGYYPCAIGAKAIVCVRSTPGSPPRLEAIAIATGKVRVLAAPNAALMRSAAPREENLRWTDGEGHSFTGYLFLPADTGGRRVPLFITYYVCRGFLRGGTGDEYPLLPFAEKGIAALCINRANTGPGSNDNVADYRYALAGITTIVDRLDRRGQIDRHRIGMGGLSFGSEITLWVATHSNLLAAASISSTLFEPAYWWFYGVKGKDIHAGARQGWGLGAPDETPRRWKAISPALNTDRIHVPLLMQMPEQEFRLNMELYSRLSEEGKPVELYAFPNEPHIKVQPRHKLAVYRRNLDWFRYWLQGYIDPDPTKAAQYQRWEVFSQKPVGAVDAYAGPSQSRSQISISTSDRIRK